MAHENQMYIQVVWVSKITANSQVHPNLSNPVELVDFLVIWFGCRLEYGERSQTVHIWFQFRPIHIAMNEYVSGFMF